MAQREEKMCLCELFGGNSWLISTSNGLLALNHSLNKDQKKPFPRFLRVPRLTTPRSQSPSSSLRSSLSSNTTNFNDFAIIASPVVTELWICLCLTFQTSLRLDPQRKRGFGDYLIVTQIESPSSPCTGFVVKKTDSSCYLSRVWGSEGHS